MSANETLFDAPLHEVELQKKQRGELAELAFMRKAASLGFAVAKPWGDSDRYDVVVRIRKVFWRVQVKSVWSKKPRRNHYRIKTITCQGVPYSAEDIDFFVIYIFAEDAWYIFPAAVVENWTSVCLRPGSKRSQYEHYREAWRLLMPASPEATVASQCPAESVAPEDSITKTVTKPQTKTETNTEIETDNDDITAPT